MPSHSFDLLSALPHPEHATKLFGLLEGKARFVGGCVRDAFLGKAIADVDIATSLPPEDVMQRLKAGGVHVIPTGLKHGTVTAILNHTPYEITTLRKDIACDGRHAEVLFTTSWEEDAARRDFTINAMSCSLEGEVFDYFSGKEDLEKRLIRFVGKAQERCQEDALRILRFFRFFAWYGSSVVDAEALEACKVLAPMLEKLSGERIQTECLKLLSAPTPVPALQWMQEQKVLYHISLPDSIEIATLEHLFALEKAGDFQRNPLVPLACVLRSSGENIVGELRMRWKLSNEDTKALSLFCAPPLLLGADASQATQKKALRTLGASDTLTLALLAHAQNGASGTSLLALKELAENWHSPIFPINGEDLLALGVKPGKQLGDLLRMAENVWEEADYGLSKEELIVRIQTESL